MLAGDMIGDGGVFRLVAFDLFVLLLSVVVGESGSRDFFFDSPNSVFDINLR